MNLDDRPGENLKNGFAQRISLDIIQDRPYPLTFLSSFLGDHDAASSSYALVAGNLPV